MIYQVSTGGLKLDIDLKGGTQILAESREPVDERRIEAILEKFDASVRSAKGVRAYSIFIEFDASIDPQKVIKTLEDNGYEFDDYSIQTIGPALGTAFLQQAVFVLTIAFIFMAVTVFIIFKEPLPSIYLILISFADIIETLAVTQFLGINLSLATFASLLLLVGYSVDDNILLTTKVLKRGEGDIDTKIRSSRRTGFTMMSASIVALFALFIISTSSVITQIASVLLIGLLIDLVNSWVLNTNLLKRYVKRRVK
jgi:preprotein translocase subunit SecF